MSRIKYCQFIRRRPEHSAAEFRAVFDRYVELAWPMALAVGATEMQVSLGLDLAENDAIMSVRGSEAPFDGMLEFYAPDLAGALARIPVDEFDRMRAYQTEHFDIGRSSFFIAKDRDFKAD